VATPPPFRHLERLRLAWELGKFVLTDRDSSPGELLPSGPLRWLAASIVQDILRLNDGNIPAEVSAGQSVASSDSYLKLMFEAFKAIGANLPAQQFIATPWQPRMIKIDITPRTGLKPLRALANAEPLQPGTVIHIAKGEYFNTEDGTPTGKPFQIAIPVAEIDKFSEYVPSYLREIVIEAEPGTELNLVAHPKRPFKESCFIIATANKPTAVSVRLHNLTFNGATVIKKPRLTELRAWSLLKVDRILQVHIDNCVFFGSRNIFEFSQPAEWLTQIAKHSGENCVDILGAKLGSIRNSVFDPMANTHSLPLGAKHALAALPASEALQLTGCENFAIRNCYLGNSDHYSLALRRCKDITVDRCFTRNLLHSGLGMLNFCERCTVQRSVFAGVGVRGDDNAISIQVLSAIDCIIAHNVIFGDPEHPDQSAGDSGIVLSGSNRQPCPTSIDSIPSVPVCVDVTAFLNQTSKVFQSAPFHKPSCGNGQTIPGCGQPDGMSSIGLACYPSLGLEPIINPQLKFLCDDHGPLECQSTLGKKMARICVPPWPTAFKYPPATFTHGDNAWKAPTGTASDWPDMGRTHVVEGMWALNNLIMDMGGSAFAVASHGEPFRGAPGVIEAVIANNIIYGQRSRPAFDIKGKPDQIIQDEINQEKRFELANRPGLFHYRDAQLREGWSQNLIQNNVIGRRDSDDVGIDKITWHSSIVPAVTHDLHLFNGIANLYVGGVSKNPAEIAIDELKKGVPLPLLPNWLKFIVTNSEFAEPKIQLALNVGPFTDWAVRLPTGLGSFAKWANFDWSTVGELNSMPTAAGNCTAKGLIIGVDVSNASSMQAPAFPSNAQLPVIATKDIPSNSSSKRPWEPSGQASVSLDSSLLLKEVFAVQGERGLARMLRYYNLEKGNLEGNMLSTLSLSYLLAFKPQRTDFLGNKFSLFRGAWKP